MLLKTEKEIVEGKMPLESLSGVYFLIDDQDEVVYVGQSVNVFSRIAAHAQTKDFRCVSYIPCSLSQLDALESHYINKFKPKLNARHKNGDVIAPIHNFDLEATQELVNFLFEKLTAQEWQYVIETLEVSGGTLKAATLRDWAA